MNFGERYGTLDRLLYRIGFRAQTAQHALADVEAVLYDEALEEDVDPVFITALPRSGTTILLKVLYGTGHFASHTYRDMPFVLCPLLWNEFADAFATHDAPRERAHGDGLTVSGTSPEAFEEMVWKYFWEAPYKSDRIRPWTEEDRNPAFNRFFDAHMRKVVAVRAEAGEAPARYLSKNNLNIARLAAPPPPLQRGTFVVPFREPLQQAASMHRQHQRFAALHEEDDFVREYMEAIGHHEFGEGLRPVNFGGWLDEAADPATLSFWVQYWTAAYEFVLSERGADDVLLSYAHLTERPTEALAQLAESLSIPPEAIVPQADRLEPPRTHSVDAEVPAPLRERAEAVHDRLQQRATVAAQA